jgi:hypothetical protein
MTHDLPDEDLEQLLRAYYVKKRAPAPDLQQVIASLDAALGAESERLNHRYDATSRPSRETLIRPSDLEEANLGEDYVFTLEDTLEDNPVTQEDVMITNDRDQDVSGSTTRRRPRVPLTALGTIAAILVVTILAGAPFVAPQLAWLLTPAPKTTSAFERVPLPVVPGARFGDLAPSPRDPATVFDCAYPWPAPTSGAISLWVTHNVGQTWSRVALPEVTGTYCEVDAALDGSQRLVMSTFNDLDQNAQVCAHSQFFLSDDNGATWRPIAHPSLAPPVSAGGGCFALVTANHLFVVTTVNNVNNTGETLSILERSDNDGQTWQRADLGLPDGAARGFPQALDATGEALITPVTNRSGGNDFWVSHDAGASWRRTESAIATPPQGSWLIEEVFTEAPFGEVASTPQACHCVVGVSHPAQGSLYPLTVGEHLYLSQDLTQLTQWTPLPPLPVKGASAERSGVYQVLGLTGDGRLLVVGADPDAGVPDIAAGADLRGRQPRLWAWNTHTGRWELMPTQLPCPDLQTCINIDGIGTSPPAGVSIRLDGNGHLAGTSLWFRLGVGTGTNSPQGQSWYRLSIPAS